MFLEKVLTVFVLFFSTGAVIPLFRRESGFVLDFVEGDPLIQAFWFGIYGIILILIMRIWRSAVRIGTRDKLLLFLIFIPLISIFWSDAPSVTFRRSVALIGTTAFGVYLAARYSLREQLQLLGWALGICTILSFFFALIIPSLGISHGLHEGAWRGVYAHKNVLGQIMILSTAVFFIIFRGARNIPHSLLNGSFFLLSTCLLFLSDSKTSLALFISFFLLVSFYRFLRLNHKLLLIYILLVVAIASGLIGWLLLHAEEVVGALGRDVTLTGRTKVWPIVVEMIKERPLLGYGYNAFWLGWHGESRYVWLTSFETFYAHNGYLDLLLDLGFLGFGVFTVGFLLNFLRSLMLARLTEKIEGLWPVIYLSFMLIYKITEGAILVRNSVVWILYVATILSLNREHRVLESP